MDCRRADDLSAWSRKRGRMQHERPSLRPAQPTVEADELFERTPLFEHGVIEAADHDVSHVRKAVRAQEMLSRVLREGGERILALDLPRIEVVRSARAEGDCSVLARADEHPADVGV